MHDVENLVNIFKNQAFPAAIRQSSANQLCIVLQDHRFAPILQTSRLLAAVQSELSQYTCVFSSVQSTSHTPADAKEDTSSLLIPCLKLLLLICMYDDALTKPTLDVMSVLELCTPCMYSD